MSYCVIAEKASDRIVIRRRWFATEREACEHAAEMIREHSNGGKTAMKLYVVKAVMVVELCPPPINARSLFVNELLPKSTADQCDEASKPAKHAGKPCTDEDDFNG